MKSTNPGFPSDPENAEETGIFFSSADVGFLPENTAQLHDWIAGVIDAEACQLLRIQYIFCSDEHLLQINKEYLQHDYLTDIITFPYQDPPVIESDIFISIDRVRENAEARSLSFSDELHRVMIHGVLHLCGHGDKSPAEQTNMRQLEDRALQQLFSEG